VLGFVAPAAAETVDVSGVGHGTVLPSFGGSGTPLLDQFEYRYSNSDHHLKTVASRPGAGFIEIAFADSNGDDEYSFRHIYQRVSFGVSTGSMHNQCGGGACTRTISRPPGDVVFVITGFKFDFGGDHHIDSIGIVESNGQLTTWFDDQNNDDDYTVDVDFAWVPRSRLGTLGEVRPPAPVHASGTSTVSTVSGNKIIRGFRVNKAASGQDDHIKSFGIRTNSTSINVLYGDQNPADSPDWTYRVQFAVLL